MNISSNNTMKVMPVFLALLCMGFVDVEGTTVSLAKETFQLPFIKCPNVLMKYQN